MNDTANVKHFAAITHKKSSGFHTIIQDHLKLHKSIPYKLEFYADNTIYIVATPTVRIVLIRTMSPESRETSVCAKKAKGHSRQAGKNNHVHCYTLMNCDEQTIRGLDRATNAFNNS